MSEDKQSAIEAAARAFDDVADIGWGVTNLEDALKAAILAYLSALVEDEGAVEAVARAMCIENMTDPDDILTSKNVPRWQLWTYEARAGVHALLTRAQGESS